MPQPFANILALLATHDVVAWQCAAALIAVAATAALLCSWISKRRLSRALERHRRDEARLRATIGQMPAIVWTTDRDLRVTSSEGAGLAALGLAPGQTVGMTFYEYFQTNDPTFTPIASHLQALEGKSRTYEQQVQGRTMLLHCEPLRDAAGTIVGTVGAAFDITPRKKAEQALAVSEAKNRALLTAIPDVMFRLTRDGKLLEFIDKLVAPNPNYVGADVRHVFPPDVAGQFLAAAAAAVKSGEAQVFEYRTTIRDRPRYYEARVVACCGDEALAIVRNVTERRAAEDELRRREAQLRSVIRAIPDLLFQFTRDGRIAGCIAQNPDDLVRPVDELLGRLVTDVLPPQQGALFTKHVRLAAETGQPQVCQYPLDIQGEPRWFEARLVAADDGSDLVIGLIRNITETVDRGGDGGRAPAVPLTRAG